MIKIEFLGTTYNKSSLTELIKRILHSDDPLSPEQKNILLSLFKYHPNYEKKKDVGISDVVRRKNRKYGQTEFWIIRTDNSETDISYKKCIECLANPDCRETLAKNYFRQACRTAVSEQIDEYRKDHVKEFWDDDFVPDEYSGEMIPISETIVHHEDPSFEEIIQKFIIKYNLDEVEIGLNKISGISEDGSCEHTFSDKSLEIKFSEFHREIANLCIIHIDDHRHLLRT
ncbi:hypothetical protein LCGC14_0873230 [marine sediment metagenome]|uniref:Uncharacterized protein n=1 Tax=marine sediment metagenome TaxID=412755 RepID=A0A0F9P416_9ZZZZ